MKAQHYTTDEQFKLLDCYDPLEQLRRRVSHSYDVLLAAAPDDVRSKYLAARTTFRFQLGRVTADRKDRGAYLRAMSEAQWLCDAAKAVINASMPNCRDRA